MIEPHESDRNLHTVTLEHDFMVENFKNFISGQFLCSLAAENTPKRVNYSGKKLPIVYFKVYTNCCGNVDNGKYVGVRLTLHPGTFLVNVDWAAVLSVVNADGDAKFFQTVGNECVSVNIDTTAPGQCAVLDCPRFVERRLLLENEEEFLPGGTLTLKCEMELKYYVKIWDTLTWAVRNDLIRSRNSIDGCLFNLKSPLYSILCEESLYFKEFRDIFESKDEEEWIPITDHVDHFTDMLYFLETKNLDHVQHHCSSVLLYELADKYVMENLKNQLRNLMIKSLNLCCTVQILLRAYRYFDKELKDACFDYVNSLSVNERFCVKQKLEEAEELEHIIAELFPVNCED